MIDKQEFYHGAALIRVVEDKRCRSIAKSGAGFVVNDGTFAYLKYRTKERTPWTFQFGPDELEHLNAAESSHPKVVVAFICGGDGVCGIAWQHVKGILGDTAGWISCSRRFSEQYGISGSNGSLRGKVALRQWPSIVFEI